MDTLRGTLYAMVRVLNMSHLLFPTYSPLEPRITLGIPIIGAHNPSSFAICALIICTGCPDYIHLMSRRAQASGIAFEPPYIPKTFLALVQRNDPTAVPYTAADASNPFAGKKVLVLSGAADPVVPWESSDAFVKDLSVGPSGAKKVIVYEGVGHTCTDAMLQEMANFVWKHVLNAI